MAINMAANPPSNSLLPFQAGHERGRDGAGPRVRRHLAVRRRRLHDHRRRRRATAWPASTSRTGDVDAELQLQRQQPRARPAVVGNTLYLVGDFTAINGTARRRAAAIDLTHRAVTSFNPNLNAKTYAVAYSAATNQILVGGNFTTVGGHGPDLPCRAQPGQRGSAGPALQPAQRSGARHHARQRGNGERVFIAGGGGFNSAAAWNIGGGGRIWRSGPTATSRPFASPTTTSTSASTTGSSATRRCGSWPPTPQQRPSDPPAASRPRPRGSTGVMAIDTANGYLVSAGKFPRMGGVAVRGVSVHRRPLAQPPKAQLTRRAWARSASMRVARASRKPTSGRKAGGGADWRLTGPLRDPAASVAVG